MYNVLMAFVFACPAVSVADRVPDKAELRAILREASSDIYAKRYDAAFDKHLWFHRNMSTIERALDGPPLAYWHELRLANWRKLAENHPPVVSKLKQIRADAQRDVLKGTDGGESFLLMAEINQTLGEGYHTIATLIDLGERDPKACKQLFGHARPYILRARAHSLYAKYVDPDAELARLTAVYRNAKKKVSDRQIDSADLKSANQQYANDVTTLVGSLTSYGRKQVALKIADSASAEWNDAAFQAELELSLMIGFIPDPLP